MIAMQVARMIAHFCLFLDLTDDNTVDPDAAVEAMEVLGADLEAFDKNFLRELVDAFALIAPEYNGNSRDLVLRIPHDYYLEEMLASDDPVRSAELDTLRDAEEVDHFDIREAGGWKAHLLRKYGSTTTG